MTLYTATGATFLHTGDTLSSDTLCHDSNFSTSTQWQVHTTNDSTQAFVQGTATWDASADVEALRIAKLQWRVQADGISASRRGNVRFKYDLGGGFSPMQDTTDEFGNPADWFGINTTMNGVVSVPIPIGVSAATFRLYVECNHTNNRNVIFDYFEFYIDSSAATGARVVSMMLPGPVL